MPGGGTYWARFRGLARYSNAEKGQGGEHGRALLVSLGEGVNAQKRVPPITSTVPQRGRTFMESYGRYTGR